MFPSGTMDRGFTVYTSHVNTRQWYWTHTKMLAKYQVHFVKLHEAKRGWITVDDI